MVGANRAGAAVRVEIRYHQVGAGIIGVRADIHSPADHGAIRAILEDPGRQAARHTEGGQRRRDPFGRLGHAQQEQPDTRREG